MKYYHVIYNSSQKGLNGSNGFGIRTATEGTPREYLDAIVKGVADNKFANVVTNCNVPLPQELMETEGKAILRVPPRYFFQTLDVIGGRKLYTLGRNIYVGFTETFYYKDKEGNILGKSGRMGTYLIDMYIFEECPSKEVFDILYEQPAKDEYGKDCNSFVPKDPSPFRDNFEMANLTTGDPVMLEPEERKFTSIVNTFSPKVIDLLLAIMDAKLSNRQLFVKYPWQQTHQLIADAFRFLPDNNISELSFSTNYTGNGFNATANVLFINEYYKAQFIGKGLLVDLEATTYQGNEAKAFRSPIEEAMKENDYGKIRKIVAWVLSPAYKTLGDASADTKAVLFIYSQIPDDFKIKMVDEAKDRDELVSKMARYFSQSRDNNSRFLNVLTEKIDLCNNINEIIRAVKDLEYYESKGIDVNSVINDQWRHINDVIMNPIEKNNALQAINHLNLKVVRKYTNDLHDGRDRSDLAIYLLEVWKDNMPKQLNSIKDYLVKTKNDNYELYKLILKNFNSLFQDIYQRLVSNITPNNISNVRSLLEENIISPLYSELSLHDCELFNDFSLLYNILSDNERYIDANNYQKAIQLIGRLHIEKTKVGQEVKKLVFDYASHNNINQTIEYLTSIWHLKANDILSECQDSPMKKDIIKGIIEFSGFDLQKVMMILDQNRIDKEFLTNSKRYGNEYKSYKRKESFGKLFDKIIGLFKRPKKEEDESPKDLKINNNLSKRREFYKNRPREEWPDDLKMWFIVVMMSLGGIINASAVGQYYHNSYGDVKDAPNCYVVSAKTLNARTSPSLYKGKKKKRKRKDNIGFKLNQGDTVFVSSLYQPMTADGVKWLGFTKDGIDFYADLSKFVTIKNPRHITQVPKEETSDGGFWGWLKSFFSRSDSKEAIDYGDGFLGWLQKSAPTILMVLTSILCIFYILGKAADEESIMDHFRAEIRDETNMRPMFMYSLRPYKSVAKISLTLLSCFVASIVIMLAIGGVVWILLWALKLLAWGIIIIGWICVIVGIICIFINWGYALVALIIGGIICYFQENLEAFGNKCVEVGMAFFDAINVWDFSLALASNYWAHVLIICITPMVLFLLAAALIYMYALCLRGYEAYTTHRYNVKHPCPWCHEPSEPAEYYDEDPENGVVKLPTNLRPGIYGLLYITHPDTGTRMPTLISNGRDTLKRKCPHCGQFVNFETGTEKHIGFIGMPDSGKTSLLCDIIGLMMQAKPDMHFTNTTDENIIEIQDYVDYAKAHGHLDENHLPSKTDRNWRASIQCILPRTNGGLPYHIYFNDVSGELFTAGGNDKNLLRFSLDIENIVFIIDPFTMKFNEQRISDRMKKWLDSDEIAQQRQSAFEEALNAFDSLVNVLSASNREFSKINLSFALVKSDTGYLEGINTADENQLKSFMKEDMGIGNIIHGAETRFMSVSYIAVSVYQNKDQGVQTLCNKLIQQLEIE